METYTVPHVLLQTEMDFCPFGTTHRFSHAASVEFGHVASYRTLCGIPSVPCAGGMKIKRCERVTTTFSR